jgi:hypothetical protein
MNHIFNLNRIAEQVTKNKVAQSTFYHKLIAAFKGANILTKDEADDVLKQIDEGCNEAKSLILSYMPTAPEKPVDIEVVKDKLKGKLNMPKKAKTK